MPAHSPLPGAAARPHSGWHVRIVVLNWNAAHLTARCVRSLLAAEELRDGSELTAEIVIVDNGSIDGSVPLLRRWFPDLTLIENPSNLGFAEGCNRALRDLDGIDAVALVNNDAVVRTGWLEAMVARMRSDPRIGAVAPRIRLDSGFVTVRVRPAPLAGAGRVRLERVSVDGLDATDRVLAGDGVVRPPDPSIPLRLEREVERDGELHVPVPADAGDLTIAVRSDREVRFTLGDGDLTAAPTEGIVEATLPVTIDSHRRINSLGTGLTAWTEGFERRAGEADRNDFPSEEVPGWSGGGVLLRADALRSIGLFDPSFFAYYEDTDLSWRGRRAGWITVTEPAAVIDHVLGATGGSTWPGFFVLNYRNWLLTVLRNGGRRDIAVALRTAARLAWVPTRHNVIGRLRRLRRPDWRIASRWGRVAASLAGAAPRVLAHRSGPVGTTPTDRVRSIWQPRSSPRTPAPRPDGPTVVFVDVTETLRSGWRAGIQRVVTELVVGLTDRTDIELVPIIWSELDGAYRRLGPDETASLLAPPTMRNHPPAPPSPHPIKRIIGPLTRGPKVTACKDAVRHRRALATRPAGQADLVVHEFPAGSVFFDPDATWNLRAAPRAEWYPRLARTGVRIVSLQHDLLPVTNPAWFDPNLAQVFRDHTDAVTTWADLVICNSRHTESELRSYAAQCGRRVATTVVTFGADAASSTPVGELDDELLTSLDGRRIVLTVGTVEPRKNHTAILDAFDRLGAAHPDATLVIAGRQGWRVEDVADRIRRHPGAGTSVVWPASVSDATLAALYRRADVVVVASHSEGFGLPLIEALGHGAAVVSSSGGALSEVGADAVTTFDPSRPDELAEHLDRLLGDPAELARARERARLRDAPRWADCVAAVASALRSRLDS